MRVRKVLAALLAPSKVRAMESMIRTTCETLVNRFAERGAADIIATWPRRCRWPSSVRSAACPRNTTIIHAYSEAFMLRTDADPRKVEAARPPSRKFDAAAREVIRHAEPRCIGRTMC